MKLASDTEHSYQTITCKWFLSSHFVFYRCSRLIHFLFIQSRLFESLSIKSQTQLHLPLVAYCSFLALVTVDLDGPFTKFQASLSSDLGSLTPCGTRQPTHIHLYWAVLRLTINRSTYHS